MRAYLQRTQKTVYGDCSWKIDGYYRGEDGKIIIQTIDSGNRLRSEVSFEKVSSPMFKKDISALKGYNYDIRQILLDNISKDNDVEADLKFIGKVEDILDLESKCFYGRLCG